MSEIKIILSEINKMKEKKNLREYMLSERKTTDFRFKRNYDNQICKTLKERLITNQDIKVVHSYLPIKGEIDITPFLDWSLKNNIKIICPKVIGKGQMESIELEDLQKIDVGPFRTIHPGSNRKFDGETDLVLVPGLAFDLNLNRLGYGGGYYDRFLRKQTKSKNLALLYPFQLIETVPIEQHDIKVDELLLFSD